MFKAPFLFDGRIRRTEYGITLIIYTIYAVIVNVLAANILSASMGSASGIAMMVLYIPVLWFVYAQGAKRCHDVGKSGWWQLIPFYVFFLLFQEGDVVANEYGINPKTGVDNTTNMIDSIGQDKV
jgi:uncharacterized membrane protein YhaH (DUF805 family)